MSTSNPTRFNHFVQQAYLRRWSGDGQNVFEYKTVIPHANYPAWRPLPLKSAASLRDLYTVDLPDHEPDHYEKWFNQEVEIPAADVLEKVAQEKPLTKRDLEHLVRYAFAQSVRTPTDYIAHRKKMEEIVPELLDRTLKEAVQRLPLKSVLQPSRVPRDEALPLSVTREMMPDGRAALKAEFEVGPLSWLASRKAMIRDYPPRFMHHRWQILRAHESMEWITSDHPVLRLGYFSNQPHDFQAGWNQRGADIIMPLTPRHLLHTEVGRRKKHSPELAREKTFELLGLLAQNARRSIYARIPIAKVGWFRERAINLEVWNTERELWG